jgi:hypothetical protein
MCVLAQSVSAVEDITIDRSRVFYTRCALFADGGRVHQPSR